MTQLGHPAGRSHRKTGRPADSIVTSTQTRTVGDLNGDGLADLGHGRESIGITFSQSGGLGVLGVPAIPDVVIDCVGLVDDTDAGDLNGGGFDDLAIAVDEQVAIFYGPLSAGTLQLSDADVLITGLPAALENGLTFLPDQDSDGDDELVFTSLFGVWTMPGGSWAGTVIPDTATMGFAELNVYNWAFACLRETTTTMGDIDGDGLDEMACYTSEHLLVMLSPFNTVGTGATESLGPRTLLLDPPGLAAPTGHFATGEDLDGDGIDDLVMQTASGRPGRREVLILSGVDLGRLPPGVTDPRSLARVLEGDPRQGDIGNFLVMLPDVTGDGLAELLVPDQLGHNLYLVPGARLARLSIGQRLTLPRTLPQLEAGRLDDLAENGMMRLGDHSGNGRAGFVMMMHDGGGGHWMVAF